MLGSVVRRGSRYSICVYAGIDPATKKQRQKWYGGFETRRDAEMFRATLAFHPTFSAGLGLYGSSRLRVGDYLDQWLTAHTSTKQVAETTEVNYRLVNERHLKPVLGHIPLARLSPQTIQDLYAALLHKGLSRTSVRHIANQLHLALEHAMKRGLIARNPVDQTDPPARDTPSSMTLSPEQLRKYLDDARKTAPTNLWVLYLTMAGTGLRLGEALGLCDADLDLEHGILSVRQALKQSGEIGKPKTERSRRAVTLPLEVVGAIRQLRKWKVAQRLRLGPKFRDCGLIFCTPRGRPLHQNNIRQRDFYPRLDRLQLPRIRLHDLRHSHGTQLIAAGVDPRTVADRLGHSSPAFTMSVYVHGVSESQRRAAEVVESDQRSLAGTALPNGSYGFAISRSTPCRPMSHQEPLWRE